MRPPPVGGGYRNEKIIRKANQSCFNEAAARGRRIPSSAWSRSRWPRCFNEAAARGRRIPTVARIHCGSAAGFNEAAARGRRILVNLRRQRDSH